MAKSIISKISALNAPDDSDDGSGSAMDAADTRDPLKDTFEDGDIPGDDLRLGTANGGIERPGVHGDPHVDLHVVTGEAGISETDEQFFAMMVSFTSPDSALTLESLPQLEAVLMIDDEEVSSTALKPSMSPDGGGWYSGALDLRDVEDGSEFSVMIRVLDSSSVVSVDGKPLEGETFSSVSNVLKTKHDTAKNSVGNIR